MDKFHGFFKSYQVNPFLNPVNNIPFLKEYIFTPGRLYRFSPKQMNKFRDKLFRRIVEYAYSVPLYRRKYKEAGVTPSDIKSIYDIVKLPFITKKDVIENFPDGIIPLGYNKNEAYIASTGGSSGKPVSLFTDFYTMSQSLLLSIREGISFGFNPRKVRFANIGTHLEGRIDYVFHNAVTENAQFFRKANSYLTMNAFDPMREIVERLDTFKPDIIYTYPVTLQHIAYLKKKGYGPHINPKLLMVSGYSLDEYTKRYVEDAFGCRMVNLYQSVEGAGDIAFECFDGVWHVNYDFYHLEAIDENMELVDYDERGHVVLTRLFGRGTPFIRYTGMDDWVTLLPETRCNCGLFTPVLKNGVEGRVSAQIILPDGRVYPAASFAIISLVLNELKTYKVIRFQIIQNKIDDIEILLVIDDDLRDVGPSVDLIFQKIQEAYEKKCGPDVRITVKEVKEIKSPPGKPLPLVISKVKPEEGYKIIEV